MKKKLTIINGMIMFILATSGISIIGAAIQAGTPIVKADSGKDIIPYTREDGSGTRSAFIELTGLQGINWIGESEDTTSDDIAIIGSSEEMMLQVSNTPNSIGYVSYAVEKKSDVAKTLTVEGVAPTIDTIKNESYPLIRDFQLVYHENMTNIEKDFLTYIKSEGQGYISDYCVPVRNQGIYLANGSSGDLTISGSTSMTPMMGALAKKYMEANPNANVTVKSSDSESGMMDVLEGNSNFGMVSRDLKSYEKSLLASEKIGRDAIAIIVNPESTLNDISLAQLKKIYNGSLTTWNFLNVYK